MTVAGDLHWERISRGIHETKYWANDYKYRILDKNRDSVLSSQGAWQVFYQWRHDSSKKWIRLRGMSSYDTLRTAKKVCRFHNLHPRRRFKFISRVTDAFIQSTPCYRQMLGALIYKECDDNGEFKPTSMTHIVWPSTREIPNE